MYVDPETHSPMPSTQASPFARRAERHAVEMLARYAWRGLRGTVMLKDLTDRGARIEGLEALRQGDGLTLLLPGLPAIEATVAWSLGRAAGLHFDAAIEPAALARIVRDFAATEGAGPRIVRVKNPRPEPAPVLVARLCA